MRYGLGLDIGTSTTSAATRSGVVRFTTRPDLAALDLKRRLGDPSPVMVDGRAHAPAELLAGAVRSAVEAATTEAGEPPASVVLTYPAIWGPYRSERFGEVPALAGLANAREVTEAEAVATYYGPEAGRTAGRTVVVYDLGAGTFDAAVFRATGSGWELLGTAEGADRVGGLAFDEVLRTLAGGEPEQVREAKEALSTRPEVALTVDGREITVSRADFEREIGPLLGPTLEAVHRALRSAGLGPADVDAILLAGGSTRIPLVTRRLAEEFGRPVRGDDDPEHVAARGAALIAEADAVPAEPMEPADPWGLTGKAGALEAPQPHLRLLGIAGLVLGLLVPLVVIIVFLVLSGGSR